MDSDVNIIGLWGPKIQMMAIIVKKFKILKDMAKIY